MGTVERRNGGMVTCEAGQWVTVVLNPAALYWLMDTGYDSDGAAQTSAKLFYNLVQTEVPVGFSDADGCGYVRQSTSTYQPAIPIRGYPVLKLGATGAETTAMLILDTVGR